MSLLPNIAYQLILARRRRHHSGPEAGPFPNACDANLSDDFDDIDDRLHLPGVAQYLSSGDDEEIDDNQIIQQLEREEYPDQHSEHRRLSRSNTWSSLTTMKSALGTRLSVSWSKLRVALDPVASDLDLESYTPHYRSLPVISGVVMPLSVLLEIPGLTEDWYIRTEANKTIDRKLNTTIFITGLAISMLFGVLANICVIYRFLEKRVQTMTLLCIIFLTVHDLINITAVTTFGIEHRFSDGFTYGQGFWMIVCSTSVSTFTNITLVIDLIRTPRFATSGSGLTRKQRSLVISLILLMCYIAFGALVETYLMDLTFLNALYLTVVTIETIGFGDIYPKTTGARIFTCLYIVIGMVSLALTVSLLRETVLEGIEVGYRKRVRDFQKRRRILHRTRCILRRWRAAIEFHLHQIDQPVWVKHPTQHQSFYKHCFEKARSWLTGGGIFFRRDRTLTYGDHSRPHNMHLNLEALAWPQLEAAAMEAGAPLRTFLPPGFKPNTPSQDPVSFMLTSSSEGGFPREGSVEPKLRNVVDEGADVSLTHSSLGRMIVMLGGFGLAVNHSQFSKIPKEARPPLMRVATLSDNYNRSRPSVLEPFDTLQAAMDKEEKRAFYIRLCAVWMIFVLFWTVGSALFMLTEKWSYGTALYFCFVSFTALGYGDYTPRTPAGRSIFIVWALLGAATMTSFISILSEAYSSQYKRVFGTNTFSRALRRYRERIRDATAQQKRPPASATLQQANIQPNATVTMEGRAIPATMDEALDDSRRRAEEHLATMPHKLLRHALSFKETVQYLMSGPEGVGLLGTDIPDELKQMMDDVAGVEKLGERFTRDILKDSEARNALLTITIEQAVRTLVGVAEEALEAIKKRDRLADLRYATGDVVFPPPAPSPGSS